MMLWTTPYINSLDHQMASLDTWDQYIYRYCIPYISVYYNIKVSRWENAEVPLSW